MEISKTEIGNALTSADDNHILATANDIYDETQQAYQSEINQSLKEGKQDKLVSGTNIKTINGTSLLGSGDISIDAEHAEEADYAETAEKLANARTISLSGGAVGTATSFDGSKSIIIPVTNVYDSYISWGGKLIPNGISPLDATSSIFSANRLAFSQPEKITIEYSNDGGVTWNNYNTNNGAKTVLVTPELGAASYGIGGKNGEASTPKDMVRIILDGEDGLQYYRTDKLLVRTNRIDSSVDKVYLTVTMERRDGLVYQDTYKYLAGWPGWNSIPIRQVPFGCQNLSAVFKKITLIMGVEAGTSSSPCIANLMMLANTVYKDYSSSMSKTGHLYSYDWQQNATFPNTVKSKKFITDGGTNQQVVLGNGSLKSLDELSPITDADAEILLDNHIHSINVNANGNDVNISVIESSKNGNTWETEEKNIPLPVATQGTAGIISAADKKKIDNINYEDNTLFVGDGMDGTLAIGHEPSRTSAEMRVFRDRLATIHTTSYNDTSGGSLAVMEAYGGKGRMEVNGDKFAELVLSGAGQVRTTLTKENEDGTKVKTIIDAEEGITAPKLATIGGTSEQILLGDGTLITFDELKAKLGLI